MRRTVYFISDHTGITVESMGRALLSQFEELEYDTVSWPFIDSLEKARRAAESINKTVQESAVPPIVFSSLVDPEYRRCFNSVGALVLDFFATFTQALEKELQTPSSPVFGHFHGMHNPHAYNERIHAVNFAFANDDGAVTKNYPAADLILIGVSRSGKTPTSLFLGLQHGILTANYPLTEDDLHEERLPLVLEPHRKKLFGLTIDPFQLQRIRSERRPDSRYASLGQCREEVMLAEGLFKNLRIPFLDTTSMSIEEIAARLKQITGLKDRL